MRCASEIKRQIFLLRQSIFSSVEEDFLFEEPNDQQKNTNGGGGEVDLDIDDDRIQDISDVSFVRCKYLIGRESVINMKIK